MTWALQKSSSKHGTIQYRRLYILRNQRKWTRYICDHDYGSILKRCLIILICTFFGASVAICIAVKPAVPMIMHSWEIDLEDSGEHFGRLNLDHFDVITKTSQNYNIYCFCSDQAICRDCFHTICTSETVAAHSAAPPKWKQVASAQAIPPALGTTRCSHHHNSGQSCCLTHSKWKY